MYQFPFPLTTWKKRHLVTHRDLDPDGGDPQMEKFSSLEFLFFTGINYLSGLEIAFLLLEQSKEGLEE